jgi:hypothetical protein
VTDDPQEARVRTGSILLSTTAVITPRKRIAGTRAAIRRTTVVFAIFIVLLIAIGLLLQAWNPFAAAALLGLWLYWMHQSALTLLVTTVRVPELGSPLGPRKGVTRCRAFHR